MGEDGDEAVAAAGHVGNVAGIPLAIPERSAQAGDLNAERRLADGQAWPDPGHNLVFGHHLVRMLDQDLQDVECAAAERDRVSFLSRSLSAMDRRNGPNEITSRRTAVCKP